MKRILHKTNHDYIYKRWKDPCLEEGQFISDMLVYACQVRIMLEKEQWSTGLRSLNRFLLDKIKHISPSEELYIRYAYDQNDHPENLALLEVSRLTEDYRYED